ncbi:MAG: DUF2784 domain-containing protein [Calditrichaeota bacterium]|nr:MAG: DUF2784 domain-containing protein [Calditrichota bacterium]
MSKELLYLLIADALLISHVLFVAFVVLGVVLIFVGAGLSWAWVRHFWFRILHLASIFIVVLESWFGISCPLTVWEMQLREMAGDTTYGGSFIEYWLQRILYYNAPEWVFTVCYTLFGGLVLASWIIVRPNRPKQLGRPKNKIKSPQAD